MDLILWIVAAAFLFYLLSLYRHGVTDRNHLTTYIGQLLLSPEVYSAHSANFEDWIRQRNETTAMSLSSAAMQTIQQMADRLAAGDPKNPATSSVLGFNAALWHRKQQFDTQKNRPAV